jgi:hypothetical protein
MFPFDLEDEDIDIDELAEEIKTNAEYEIDPITGRLTGNVIRDLDAVVQWVRLVLNTPRYMYQQYSWDYGHELDTLIGSEYDQDLIESEVNRMITDALSINEDIEGIDNLVCDFDGDRLTVSFVLITSYGETEVGGINV